MRGVWKVRAAEIRRSEQQLSRLGPAVAADHVQRGGLARSVRPDQPMHQARCDAKVQPVDRPHAAERQHHATQLDRRPRGAMIQQSGKLRLSRHDGAISVQRAAVREIE